MHLSRVITKTDSHWLRVSDQGLTATDDISDEESSSSGEHERTEPGPYALIVTKQVFYKYSVLAKLWTFLSLWNFNTVYLRDLYES